MDDVWLRASSMYADVRTGMKALDLYVISKKMKEDGGIAAQNLFLWKEMAAHSPVSIVLMVEERTSLSVVSKGGVMEHCKSDLKAYIAAAQMLGWPVKQEGKCEDYSAKISFSVAAVDAGEGLQLKGIAKTLVGCHEEVAAHAHGNEHPENWGNSFCL